MFVQTQTYTFNNEYYLLLQNKKETIDFTTFRLSNPKRVVLELSPGIFNDALALPSGPVTKIQMIKLKGKDRIIFYIKEDTFYNVINKKNMLLIGFKDSLFFEESNFSQMKTHIQNSLKNEQKKTSTEISQIENKPKKQAQDKSEDALISGLIEDHQISLNKIKLIKDERLKKFGQSQANIEKERDLKLEKEKKILAQLKKEKLEKERLEKLEQQRIAKEKERKRIEKLERERKILAQLKKEKLEKERLEKLEQQRIAKEKERKRIEKLERERKILAQLKKEKLEKERLEKLEQQRIAKEKERKRIEKLERERKILAQLKKEKLEKERLEKLEQQRIAKEKERKRIEKLERERKILAQLKKEKLEKERLEKLEQQRIAKEKERKRIEKLEKEKRILAQQDRDNRKKDFKVIKADEGTKVLAVKKIIKKRQITDQAPYLPVVKLKTSGKLKNLLFRKFNDFSRVTMKITGDVEYRFREIKGGYVIDVYNLKKIPRHLLYIIDARAFNADIKYIYPKKVGKIFKIYIKSDRGVAVRKSEKGSLINFDFFKPDFIEIK